MRWMRVVERGGDRNEDVKRRKDVEEEGEEKEKEDEEKEEEKVVEEKKERDEEEERRERKEGVRVRVRLGVGGAIRNYCGTIDKRRLRGRTTEDSLRPSDFPSTVASLFHLFSPGFRSRVMSFYPYPCLAHETFQIRQYVMFENPRATPSPSGRSTWNRRFCPTLYISVDAPSKPRWDKSIL